MTKVSTLKNLKNWIGIYFDHVYYDSDFSKNLPHSGRVFVEFFLDKLFRREVSLDISRCNSDAP